MEETMQRLLVADDASPYAETVLQDLSYAGLSAELEVLVVTVADVWLPINTAGPQPVTPPVPPWPAIRKAREQALEAVRSAQAQADGAAERLRTLFPKWNTSGWACADSPAWGILTKAAEWKADLILVGSHGRSALERLFLGSVSQKVVAEAVCSVRIARPRPHPQLNRLRIVTAIDGSPDSLGAVRAVAGRAWPASAEFKLVAVMDPRLETALAWPDIYGADWVLEQDQAVRDAVGRMTEESAGVLRAARLKVDTQILHGDPKQELLRYAQSWEADAIFLGARGRQHGGRLALGTMASAVTARAHCSVEVVRVG
jgi:nucleotide-binding universal stress UspA family protein